MKTITVAAPKGGTSKTSTTTLLAVRASQEPARVAMLDLNADQASLTQWWTMRGRSANPYLLADGGQIAADVELLRADGWDYCIIDTPPLEMDVIETAVMVADAVVVPVLLSYMDIVAIDSVVDMCRRRRKPFAFLVSSFDGRQSFRKVNRDVLDILKPRGPIMAAHVSYNAKIRAAQFEGKTGAEIDKTIAAEVDAVWSEVKTISVAKKVARV